MAITEEGEVVHVKSLWDLRPFDMVRPGVFVRAIQIGGIDHGFEARKLCMTEEKIVMDDGRVERLQKPCWGTVVYLDLPGYVRRGVKPPLCPSD